MTKLIAVIALFVVVLPFSAIRQRDARITSAWAVHPSRTGVVRLWCVHVAASTRRVDNDGIQIRPGPREPNCPGALVRTADGDRTWQRIELNMIPPPRSTSRPRPSGTPRTQGWARSARAMAAVTGHSSDRRRSDRKRVVVPPFRDGKSCSGLEQVAPGTHQGP